MTEFEQGAPPEQEAAAEKIKLTREEVEARLARGENMENLDLKDLDLAGLDLHGKSFRGSEICGIILYGEKPGEDGKVQELVTNIRDADFTDATIADLYRETIFGRVEAEGAIFGFSEDLTLRRARHIAMNKLGERPEAADTGALYSFNGSGGNFRKTKWINVDFGGGFRTNFEAFFAGADLTEAEIIGCDLSGIDLSTVKIDRLKIKDPLSLEGLIITAEQAETLSVGIELSDEREAREFSAEVLQKGAQKALQDYFEIIVK